MFSSATLQLSKHPRVKDAIVFTIIYILWCFIHGISVELYYIYCTPRSPFQYLLIPFYNETPHCKIFSWFQNTSKNSLQSICIIITSFVSKKIMEYLIISNDNNIRYHDKNN